MFEETNESCLECKRLNLLLEEKEKNIQFLEKNLYDIKHKIVESSNLISIYMNCKHENEYLKNQIDNFNKNKHDATKNSLLMYEFEVLKTKYLKETERANSLQALTLQLNAELDNIKVNQDIKISQGNTNYHYLLFVFITYNYQ